MPELMVKLESGETVELRECDWVFYAPCGCPRGVMSPFIMSTAIYDEGAAFTAFFDDGRKRTTQATVKRERESGVTAELMLHDRYRAEVYPRMTAKCPHTAQTSLDLTQAADTP